MNILYITCEIHSIFVQWLSWYFYRTWYYMNLQLYYDRRTEWRDLVFLPVMFLIALFWREHVFQVSSTDRLFKKWCNNILKLGDMVWCCKYITIFHFYPTFKNIILHAINLFYILLLHFQLEHITLNKNYDKLRPIERRHFDAVLLYIEIFI